MSCSPASSASVAERVVGGKGATSGAGLMEGVEDTLGNAGAGVVVHDLGYFLDPPASAVFMSSVVAVLGLMLVVALITRNHALLLFHASCSVRLLLPVTATMATAAPTARMLGLWLGHVVFRQFLV